MSHRRSPRCIVRWALCLGLTLAVDAHAASVAVADLSDAYSKSTALAGLLVDVDAELKRIRDTYGPPASKLRGDLRAIDAAAPDAKERRLALAREIHGIESAAQAAESKLIAANQRAIEIVDAAIAAAKLAVQRQQALHAVLDRHEVVYLSEACECDVTAAVFDELNRQLPNVALDLSE